MNPFRTRPWTNRALRRTRGAKPPKPTRVFLRVEPLEDRVVPVADLRPGGVFFPAAEQLEVGYRTSVTWYVADLAAPTDDSWNDPAVLAVGSWTDRLFLSADATRDAADTDLGAAGVQAVQLGYSDGLYYATTDVTVPAGTALGDYYLIVSADHTGRVTEADEANNTRAFPVAVTPPLPLPDLTPSAPALTGTPVTNGTVTVTWADTNGGPGATRPGGYYDGVYFSTDPTLDSADRQLVAQFVSAGLGAGATAARSTTATLTNVTGSGYLIIAADVGGSQNETNEANNRTTLAVTVLTPPPDLTPTALAWVGNPLAGGALALSWGVANDGAGAAPAAGRTDRVYFSTDATLDAADTLLADAATTGALAAGGVSSLTRTVTLPTGPASGFLILATDPGGAVTEANEANNTFARPISLTPPDLRPTAFTVTGAAAMGARATVSWAVANDGGPASPDGWTDYVYFSTDAVLDANDTYLLSETVSNLTAATYTRTREVTLTLPAASGFLILATDQGDVLFEGNEANNTRTLPITLPAADLVLTLTRPPTEGVAGQAVEVGWRLENVGPVEYVSYADVDYFLSADGAYDAADTRVAGTSSYTNIAAGAVVAGALTFTAPTNRAPGDYFLIARAPGNGTVYGESRADNNSVVVPFRLRGTDLRVGGLGGPAAVAAGAPLAVTFDVTNAGAVAVTDANGVSVQAWLARDAAGTNRVAEVTLYLGPDARIPVGGKVTRTAALVAPAALPAGTYYYGVSIADTRPDADPTNDAAAAAVVVTAAPPPTAAGPDVTVAVNAPPTRAYHATPFTLNYTATNAGTAPVPNSYVYLYAYYSTDAVRGPTDVQLGYTSQYSTGDPASWPAGAARTAGLSVTLPATVPTGAGYILLVADPDGYVPERDETNNAAVVPVTVAPLASGAGTDLAVTPTGSRAGPRRRRRGRSRMPATARPRRAGGWTTSRCTGRTTRGPTTSRRSCQPGGSRTPARPSPRASRSPSRRKSPSPSAWGRRRSPTSETTSEPGAPPSRDSSTPTPRTTPSAGRSSSPPRT